MTPPPAYTAKTDYHFGSGGFGTVGEGGGSIGSGGAGAGTGAGTGAGEAARGVEGGRQRGEEIELGRLRVGTGIGGEGMARGFRVSV